MANYVVRTFMMGVVIFDILSHGLWGKIIFGRHSSYWLALTFGIMPDALAFTPLIIMRVMEGISVRGASSIPSWVYSLYSLTHSLIIAGVIMSILLFFNKKVGIAAGAWILHIIMDIPVHTQEYFPTPFLYPISDFTINGVSSIKLWAVNWIILIVISAYFYLKNKRLNFR